MVCFFDYETGFYTDKGIAAWLSLLLPLAAAVLGGVLFARAKADFGSYVRRKNYPAGIMAVISGLVLLYTGAVMVMDYISYSESGFSQFESARQGLVHVAFMVMCLVFGVVQLISGVSFLSGGKMFCKLPLLPVTGVLWGMAYLVLVYVFYAKSSSFVENFFAVVGAAFLTLSLLYMCKLLAGVEEPGSALRLFIAGGLSGVLVTVYTLVNLVLWLMGKTYSGELLPLFLLCGLAVSVYVLAFIEGCSCTGSQGDERQEQA